MLREFGGHPCWLTVISTGRPQNVPRMREQIGEATWYVKRADEQTYETSLVVCESGVAVARNRALEDAFARDVPCIQLSDDLRGFKFVTHDKQQRQLQASEVFEVMLGHLRTMPFYLVGLPPTANVYFSSTKITYTTFIVGDCIAVQPNPLRFDEQLQLKEDYGYTAAHIDTYGGAMRLNWILASFEHRVNAGGAVDLRTRQLERQSWIRLHETYPGWFKRNTRREGTEILMKVPRSHSKKFLEGRNA